jgi:hypothetical protein
MPVAGELDVRAIKADSGGAGRLGSWLRRRLQKSYSIVIYFINDVLLDQTLIAAQRQNLRALGFPTIGFPAT